MGKFTKVACLALVAFFAWTQCAWSAELEALKQKFDGKKAEFEKISGEVLDAFDAMVENEKDIRLKTEVMMVRYALKENNRYAGRIDGFGNSSYKFNPYKGDRRTLPLKTLTKYDKIALQLKVPVELISTIAVLSGTYGLEDILDKCHFNPEAALARDILKNDKAEFPADEKDNPDQPLPLDDPQHKAVIDLVAKDQQAFRELYDAGEALKEKILKLRPAAGFKYPEASLTEFKQKMEELYKEKPEYKTEKASTLEEAQAVANIAGLPEEDLCKYQSYNGTMGLQTITFCVPDVQNKPWLEVFFAMIGL